MGVFVVEVLENWRYICVCTNNCHNIPQLWKERLNTKRGHLVQIEKKEIKIIEDREKDGRKKEKEIQEETELWTSTEIVLSVRTRTIKGENKSQRQREKKNLCREYQVEFSLLSSHEKAIYLDIEMGDIFFTDKRSRNTPPPHSQQTHPSPAIVVKAIISLSPHPCKQTQIPNLSNLKSSHCQICERIVKARFENDCLFIHYHFASKFAIMIFNFPLILT